MPGFGRWGMPTCTPSGSACTGMVNWRMNMRTRSESAPWRSGGRNSWSTAVRCIWKGLAGMRTATLPAGDLISVWWSGILNWWNGSGLILFGLPTIRMMRKSTAWRTGKDFWFLMRWRLWGCLKVQRISWMWPTARLRASFPWIRSQGF